MKNTILYVSFIMLFFFGCKTPKKETLTPRKIKQKKLNDFMLGSWQTTYLKVEMLTANGTDSTKVYEKDFSKKEDILAQATYHKNGTFLAWYVQPNGKKTGKAQGNWKAVNDSLFITYTVEGRIGNFNPIYKIKQTDNGFKATSVYDWDKDGKKDDTLIMKSKRIELN